MNWCGWNIATLTANRSWLILRPIETPYWKTSNQNTHVLDCENIKSFILIMCFIVSWQKVCFSPLLRRFSTYSWWKMTLVLDNSGLFDEAERYEVDAEGWEYEVAEECVDEAGDGWRGVDAIVGGADVVGSGVDGTAGQADVGTVGCDDETVAGDRLTDTRSHFWRVKERLELKIIWRQLTLNHTIAMPCIIFTISTSKIDDNEMDNILWTMNSAIPSHHHRYALSNSFNFVTLLHTEPFY